MADLLLIIENLRADIPFLENFFAGICFLIGFIFTIKALMMAQKRQEMGLNAGSWKSPLVTFIIAGLFLGLPTFINVLNVTIFAAGISDPQLIFSTADETVGMITGEEARKMITGLTLIVQFVGLIAVARGLYMLNHSAQGTGGQSTFGPGLTFVIAGVCATNFPIFVGVMESLITSS